MWHELQSEAGWPTVECAQDQTWGDPSSTHWNRGLRNASVWYLSSREMKAKFTPTEKNGNSSTMGVFSTCTQQQQRTHVRLLAMGAVHLVTR